jgi:hypothetical protein
MGKLAKDFVELLEKGLIAHCAGSENSLQMTQFIDHAQASQENRNFRRHGQEIIILLDLNFRFYCNLWHRHCRIPVRGISSYPPQPILFFSPADEAFWAVGQILELHRSCQARLRKPPACSQLVELCTTPAARVFARLTP